MIKHASQRRTRHIGAVDAEECDSPAPHRLPHPVQPVAQVAFALLDDAPRLDRVRRRLRPFAAEGEDEIRIYI